MSSARRIGMIILGSASFPFAGSLTSHQALRHSAVQFRGYCMATSGLSVQKDDLLDLWSSAASFSTQNSRLVRFVQEKAVHLSDLIVYYAGHGGFSSDGEYFLALRATQEGNELFSSFPIRALAATLRSAAASTRIHLVFDCCFSGAAQRYFQGPALTAAAAQTESAFPSGGVGLLCAAAADYPAVVCAGAVPHAVLTRGEAKCTVFSGALLAALRTGDRCRGERLTLRELSQLVQRFVAKVQGPRPQVHSPKQTAGDVCEVPLFPNPQHKRDHGFVAKAQGPRPPVRSPNQTAGDMREVLSIRSSQHDMTQELGDSNAPGRSERTKVLSLSEVSPQIQADETFSIIDTHSGKVVRVERFPFLIGRSPKADLPIDDTSVSRSHASLRTEDTGVVIVDLDSSNGTFVAGEKITSSPLRIGDYVQVGAVVLLVEPSNNSH